MNEWQGYLRFEDRYFFGESKYRPSEGWIDLEGEIFSKPGEFTVTCLPGRVLPHIIQAFSDGSRLRGAVVEQRGSDWWIRYSMTKVFIASYQYETKGHTCQLVLQYTNVKRTLG
jgi:hypothetical protein